MSSRFKFSIMEPLAFYHIKLKWMNKPFLKVIKTQVAEKIVFKILNHEKVCDRHQFRWR